MPQAQHVTTEYLHIAQHMWQAIKITNESYVHYVIPIEEITATFKQQVAQFVREQQWDEQYKTIGIMLFNVQEQYLHPLI
ncbi:diaminopimelate epimerase, partial [Staphylococcus caprae]